MVSVFVHCHSQHKSKKSVAELERTVVAMKRVVEKLQQENKRLLSGRKDALAERKVHSPLPQCRDSTTIQKYISVEFLYHRDQLLQYHTILT
jgi:hypothetical protein